MARAIDGDKLLERLQKKKAGPANKRYTEGFNDCLMRVRSMVHSMPTLTPPNEPLTIEQLREMDGEPVWVTPLGFWTLVIAKPGERVRLISNDGETVWADKEIELVGPVYRRPPEGEEDT